MTEYINLIDYLDKPELIQHVDGREIKTLIHFPENEPYNRILVVLSDTAVEYYYENSSFCNISKPFFILKSRPKRKVEGWRKDVLAGNGDIMCVTYAPTKEVFENRWKESVMLGDWQHISYEIDE